MMTQLREEKEKLERKILSSNGVNNLRVTLNDDTLELTVFKDVSNSDYKNYTLYIYDFDNITTMYKTITLMNKIVENYSYSNFNYYKNKSNKVRG